MKGSDNPARSEIDGKTILITGGTGSFGRTFVKKILNDYKPERVIIFSRDEWKQWEMRKADPIFSHPSMRYFLGDVRDKDRLLRAFSGVNIVVHAAALKQVPAAEYNPSEFVQTNVHGAMNIIDAAIDRGVQKVIALSTDKAVNPINLYGATKLCSDKLFVAGNCYVGEGNSPKFSLVRYGNVLGSRGSIIPLWRKMVQEGATELPVTDERMTRFWITLEQAACFVISCLLRASGGEIFVPKIPSMKIVDLAEAVGENLPKKIVGIREGEKLHEMLLCEEDARHCFEYDDCYVVAPQVYNAQRNHPEFREASVGGKPLPEGFTYASNNNSEWIGVDKLRELINGNPSMVEV